MVPHPSAGRSRRPRTREYRPVPIPSKKAPGNPPVLQALLAAMDTPLVTSPVATTVKLETRQDMDRDATSAQATSIQVFVTGGGKTKTVQVGMDGEERVAETVARDTCMGNMMLVYAGRPVKADATVQDLGLQHGSTLTTQPFSALCGGAGYYLPMHSRAGAVDGELRLQQRRSAAQRPAPASYPHSSRQAPCTQYVSALKLRWWFVR
eukprot:COSAG02_NODE_793_length_17156_cov_54.511051_8_plen_208_part_00